MKKPLPLQLERSATFEGTWFEDQSSEAYHADKTAVGSSSLRKILKSPANFHAHFTEVLEEKSEALSFGSAFHMALLESKRFFNLYLRQPDFGDLRSPKNREKKTEWLAHQHPQAVILDEKNYIRLEGMLNSVMKHRDASKLLLHGQAEISGYFADPETGIKCKIKPDFMNFEMGALVDVKTTQDCTLDEFSKSIWKYRYDVQMAFYSEGVRLITGREVHYNVFLAIEKEPPFECSIYVADEGVMGKGLEDYRRCLDLLSDCLHRNHWPSYQESMQAIHLPYWALNQT